MTELINAVNQEFRKIMEKMNDTNYPAQKMLDEVNAKAMAKNLKVTTDTGETKPFPVFLKPFFVDNTQVAMLQHATLIMMRVLEKVVDLYFSQPETRPLFLLKPEEEELSAIDPGYPEILRITRNDAFLSDDSFKFIEFNCDSPGGPYWADVLNDELWDSPVIKELRKLFWFHRDYFVPQTHQTLLQAYREFGGKKEKPFIAIVAGGGVTLEEFKAIAAWLNERGYPSEYSEPDWLEYDGENLKTQSGKTVDIIYRRGWIVDWTGRMDRIKPLIKAYKDKKVCVVNSPRTILGANKSLMAVIQRDDIMKIFTAAEKKVIHDHLPWTRIVEPGKTTYHGKEYDLYDLLRTQKDTLVLKPYDMLGGKGVYVGIALNQNEWEQGIEQTTKQKYVAQEYVPAPEEKFPVITDQSLDFMIKKVNVNFYAYHGRHAGGMVRTSDSAVINISAGGGLTPIYNVGGHI
ncbi:hypothetical protein ACFL27_23775 [candidate division CSSED10-310 bacterium]|uniref:Circularly permuted type 2 ATP-grasp protein n=1 Tax=candidate division CSSED10-310 bacterium TaxID=2855610 RepID=A0ABV6Z485_UNCC1